MCAKWAVPDPSTVVAQLNKCRVTGGKGPGGFDFFQFDEWLAPLR